ncbi:hypothetical protein NKH18_00450 [Streptomyces sp. M10(2022)]
MVAPVRARTPSADRAATAGRPLARTAPRARTQRARHNPPAPDRIRLPCTELGRRPERLETRDAVQAHEGLLLMRDQRGLGLLLTQERSTAWHPRRPGRPRSLGASPYDDPADARAGTPAVIPPALEIWAPDPRPGASA